jgi:hypothetical protein
VQRSHVESRNVYLCEKCDNLSITGINTSFYRRIIDSRPCRMADFELIGCSNIRSKQHPFRMSLPSSYITTFFFSELPVFLICRSI